MERRDSRGGCNLNLYLKQDTEANAGLFTVYDACGRMCYRLTGDAQTLGGKIFLCDTNHREVARITHMGLAGISRYTIVIADKERARILQNLASIKMPFRIRGISWRLRGDLVLRSFDIVDVSDALVMSHGRCWESNGECFALDIAQEKYAPLCICMAAVIDSSAQSGSAVALPV